MQSLERCHDVDSVLARLARQYPMTRFLRARAAAVGFATLTTHRSSSGPNPNSNSNLKLGAISENAAYSDEEDDEYFIDDEEGEEEEEEVVTDLDMLPTLLVYRAGQIVHNWIRVDWEAEAWGKRGNKTLEANGNSIEALLRG